jgi:SAM-dependent methyltransferase
VRNDPKRRAQARFAANAAAYVTSAVHAQGAELVRMVELARLAGDERVLDVATGPGHTALAFFPHAREVVGLDLTLAMLRTAAQHLAGRDGSRIRLVAGDAETLPFADATFDVVTCRYAAHHFPHPDRFLAEVRRVLTPRGRLVLFDNMAPEDDQLDTFLNRLEAWRDPSHVRSRRPSEWKRLATRAGLEAEISDPLLFRRYPFQEWTARQSMPEPEREALERWLLAAAPAEAEFFRLEARAGSVQALWATFGTLVARPQR